MKSLKSKLSLVDGVKENQFGQLAKYINKSEKKYLNSPPGVAGFGTSSLSFIETKKPIAGLTQLVYGGDCGKDIFHKKPPHWGGWIEWRRIHQGALLHGDPDHNRDGDIGYAGHRVQIHFGGVAGFGRPTYFIRTGLRVFYRMPTTGHVRVGVKFEVDEDHRSSPINPKSAEFSFKLGNALFVRVSAPEASNAEHVFEAETYFRNDRKGLISTNNSGDSRLQPGAIIETGCQTLNNFYKQGEWVIVEVGVESNATFWSGELEIDSSLAFSGIFREIRISSTGDIFG